MKPNEEPGAGAGTDAPEVLISIGRSADGKYERHTYASRASVMDGVMSPDEVAENARILEQMLAAIEAWHTRADGEPQEVRDRLAVVLQEALLELAGGTFDERTGFHEPPRLIGPEFTQIIDVFAGPSGSPVNWDTPPRTMRVSPGVAKVVMALLPTRLVNDAWRNADGACWIEDGVETVVAN